MREQTVRYRRRLPIWLPAAAWAALACCRAAAGAERETPLPRPLAAADRPVLDSGDHAAAYPFGPRPDDDGGAWVNQIVATAIAWGLAIAVTLVLLKFLDATMGLRVSHDEEIQGLDLSPLGEEGYIFI
jgi:hypothetical protein